MAVLATAEVTISLMVDIAGTYRFYKLVTSGTVVTKPTGVAYPPPDLLYNAGWSDSEPTYTEGETLSLHYVDCTVYSNGTCSYSEVSLSTAYEQAKEAYIKASNVDDKVDNMQTWTHTALSIDEGETLVETNIGGILEVGAISSGSDDDTTSGYVRTSEYIPLISGESYTWNVLLDEVSTIPTTWFYQRGSSEDNEVFECLNSTAPVNTATITVPPSENQVYVRASILTALTVDLISGTLTLDNLTSHLQSSDSMLYSGVSVTLNQYPPIEGKAYVWSLTDDKIQQYVTNLLSATEEKFDVDLKDLSDKIYGADGSVEELQNSLKALQDSLGNYDGYIQIIPDEATIKLGKVDPTAAKAVITNEKLSFQKNGVEGASIGYTDSTGERTSMMAESTYITENFPRVKVDDEWVGSLCWVARSNGHLSLKVVR